MPRFEYKVVPAPNRGLKAKGVKRPEDRFALALSTLMNELGAEGWDYVRADILPSEERSGLTSKQTVYHSLLVFRRPLPEEADQSGTTDREDQPPLAIAPPVPPEAEMGETPDDAQDAAEDQDPPQAEDRPLAAQ